MAASVVNGGEGGVKGKLFPLMAECLHYYPFWEASLGEFAPGFGGTSLLSSSPESNPSKPSAPSEHLGGMTTMTPWGLPPTTVPLKHRRVPWKDVNSRKNEQRFFFCLFFFFLTQEAPLSPCGPGSPLSSSYLREPDAMTGTRGLFVHKACAHLFTQLLSLLGTPDDRETSCLSNWSWTLESRKGLLEGRLAGDADSGGGPFLVRLSVPMLVPSPVSPTVWPVVHPLAPWQNDLNGC